MNWWNLLEIHHDSDVKTIKKAYAKLLKIHSPEEDAEGYQKLRQAYDMAIKYAKKNNKSQGIQNDNSVNLSENNALDKNIVEQGSDYNKEQIRINLNQASDSINNEKDNEEIDNNKIKSSVNSYIDSINNEENKEENEESNKIKSSANLYIDVINNEEDKEVDEKNNKIKSSVNLYMDSINAGKNDKETNDNNKKIKPSANLYMDALKTEGDKDGNNKDNKKIKSKVDSYIDFINDKNGKEENNNENKKIKPKANFYMDYTNNEKSKIDSKASENQQKTSKINVYLNEGSTKKKDINEQIDEFLDRLETIYSDMSLRINSELWKELLNRDVTWNIYSIQIIKDSIFKFLLDHKFLPAEVWKMLKNSFNWDKNDLQLYEKYPEQKINGFFKEFNRTNALGYTYLGLLNSEAADKFLELRQLSYDALESKDYYEAQKHLFPAYDIFKEDPELLKLIGRFYYDIGDFINALEFLKKAFDINNFDFDSALLLGEILEVSGNFEEAIPYLELYLSSDKDNKLALNYIAYCYYYSNDMQKAKESFNNLLRVRTEKSFQRLSKFESDTATIIKYLDNIRKKLDGKSVGKLKFKKHKTKIQKVTPKKNEAKTTKPFISRRVAVRAIALLLLLTINFINKNIPTAKSNINGIVNEVNKKSINKLEDDDTFKAINIVDDLKYMEYFKNIKMHLINIKSLGYYKLKEPFDNKSIVSKTEVDNNNLQDKIESELFKGTFSNNINFIFADSKCTKDNMEKDGSYIIKGAVTTTKEDEIGQITKEYKERFYWSNSHYIDCSQNEIENAKNEKNKYTVSKDGKVVRVSKTLDEFMNNNFKGINSLYLTDIVPSNMYVEVEGSKFFFLSKVEADKRKNSSSFIPVYVGKIEGKYIAFINKDFSMDNLDSNKGANIYGYIYKFTANGYKSIPIKDGSSTYEVKAELPFLYNKE